MTSKNLFFKLSLENIKRRLWTIVLIAIAFLVSGPLSFVMQLQNWLHQLEQGYNTSEEVLRFVNSYFSFNRFSLIILIGGAIFLAIHGFGYLFSKKEVDLYHSLPIKRNRLFAVNYINGIVIYSFILIIKNILCSIIAVGYGFYSTPILINMLMSMLIEISGFVLIYSTTVLAVMLTGNFVVAFFGTGILLTYGSIVHFIGTMFAEKFFKTSVYTSLYDEWGKSFVSPAAAVINIIARNVVNYSQPIEIFSGAKILKDVLILLVPAIVILLLTIFLYNKRPSETAGRAMAFGIIKKPLELLICVPLSMCGGLFLSEFSYDSQGIWLYIGTVIFGLLLYLVIETIYEFDIKAAFKLKIMPLIISVISCVIIFTFEYDVFGYDTYLPDPDKVEYAGILISGLNESFERYSNENDKLMFYSESEYIIDNMKITDIDSVLDIAKTGIASLDEGDGGYRERYSVEIYYTLSSGKKVARSYWLDYNEENMQQINQIYKLDEYKKCTSPVYAVNTDKISSIRWDSGFNMPIDIKYTKEQAKDLIEIYKEELATLDFNQVRSEMPIGNIVVETREDNYFEATYRLTVYKSFENIIKYLERIGVDISNRYDIEAIAAINIEKYSEYNNQDQDEFVETNEEEIAVEDIVTKNPNITKSITDKEEMEKILPDLVCSEFLYSQNFYSVINKKYYISISFADGNMQQYSYIGKADLC